MAKTITSPVKRFPGTVTLPDYLTFDQAITWEKSEQATRDLREPVLDENGNPRIDEGGIEITKKKPGVTDAELIKSWYPGIMACVEVWNLEGYDPNKPPSTPRIPVLELTGWLIGEITKLYRDADEIPNE